LVVCGLLAAGGYRHYEVSNFARPGFESAHNRVYWDGGDYLGVGPAAHSSLHGRRFCNAPSIDAYIAAQGRGGGTVRLDDPGGDARMEALMLGLRTDRGAAADALDAGTVRGLTAEGLAVLDAGRVRLTDRGYLVLDSIVLRLHSTTPC
jgi:oxygen-independent coproporphyrinogen-3 oxidase